MALEYLVGFAPESCGLQDRDNTYVMCKAKTGKTVMNDKVAMYCIQNKLCNKMSFVQH